MEWNEALRHLQTIAGAAKTARAHYDALRVVQEDAEAVIAEAMRTLHPLQRHIDRLTEHRAQLEQEVARYTQVAEDARRAHQHQIQQQDAAFAKAKQDHATRMKEAEASANAQLDTFRTEMQAKEQALREQVDAAQKAHTATMQAHRKELQQVMDETQKAQQQRLAMQRELDAMITRLRGGGA